MTFEVRLGWDKYIFFMETHSFDHEKLYVQQYARLGWDILIFLEIHIFDPGNEKSRKKS